jgi:hypothetical protein
MLAFPAHFHALWTDWWSPPDPARPFSHESHIHIMTGFRANQMERQLVRAVLLINSKCPDPIGTSAADPKNAHDMQESAKYRVLATAC